MEVRGGCNLVVAANEPSVEIGKTQENAGAVADAIRISLIIRSIESKLPDNLKKNRLRFLSEYSN